MAFKNRFLLLFKKKLVKCVRFVLCAGSIFLVSFFLTKDVFFNSASFAALETVSLKKDDQGEVDVTILDGPILPRMVEGEMIDPTALSPSQKSKVIHVFEDHGIALNRLKKVIEKCKRDESVRVVSVGGSPPALGQFGKYMAAYLQQYYMKLGKSIVSYYNYAHGNRDSIHAALNLDSFVPIETDVLIWEFSINDEYSQAGHKKGSEELKMVASTQIESNGMISFLNKAGNLASKPGVILHYLWCYPFLPEIRQSVFSQSKATREGFQNVLGYINGAEYALVVKTENQHLLARDKHHPSVSMNKVFGNMLFQLVEDALPYLPIRSIPQEESDFRPKDFVNISLVSNTLSKGRRSNFIGQFMFNFLGCSKAASESVESGFKDDERWVSSQPRGKS